MRLARMVSFDSSHSPRPSGTTAGELAPVEGEVHNKQGSERESDHADSRKSVAKMAPIAGPEIEHTAGDEGKRDGIGANHPLAMLDDLTISRGDQGGSGADDPRGCLHGGSWQAWAAGGEGDPGHGTDKDADYIDSAEDAMESQVTLAKARRKLYWTCQESDDAGECMGDEEMAVGDDLQTVGVVHRVIGDEKSF